MQIFKPKYISHDLFKYKNITDNLIFISGITRSGKVFYVQLYQVLKKQKILYLILFLSCY